MTQISESDTPPKNPFRLRESLCRPRMGLSISKSGSGDALEPSSSIINSAPGHDEVEGITNLHVPETISTFLWSDHEIYSKFGKPMTDKIATINQSLPEPHAP